MTTERGKNQSGSRPFVGIHFKCCNIYSRIYLNKQHDAFVGWCPKCAKKVVLKIAPDGEESQFFEVT
jgi:hypothetical protein